MSLSHSQLESAKSDILILAQHTDGIESSYGWNKDAIPTWCKIIVMRSPSTSSQNPDSNSAHSETTNEPMLKSCFNATMRPHPRSPLMV